MVQSATLGFPRIGPKREIKKAVESYWADKSSAEDLQKVAKEIRAANWKTIKDAGIDIIPSNDFSFYDHVLDMSVVLGNIPSKYAKAASEHQLSTLDVMFAMGRGRQRDGVDVEASEMRKWFDSNYHYIVPELSANTKFSLASDAKPVIEFNEAKEAGFETRPVLLGPISYLLLGKNTRDSAADFQPLSLLDSLVTVYDELLKKLKEAGATSVQIDEPVLVLDQDKSLASSFKSAYEKLGQSGLAITLATYFGRVTENLDFVKDLPIDALHIDLDRARGAPEQVDGVVSAVKDSKLKLSLGLVSGRNVWKCDLEAAIAVAKKVVDALGSDRVVVASSSSLLHTPVTLANETKLSAEQKDWFSFATEKVAEIAAISKAVNGQEDSVKEALEANKKSIAARREFEKKSDASVRERLAAVTPEQYNRKDPFTTRIEAQKEKTPLPKFPTTTIGSFPQTKEIRQARAKFTKGDISSEEYDKFIASEIEHVIKFQEKVGLDVLVHGEPERNDMVQYFGEKLEGFVFTENGWVQSYGSRYVRPPIIVSDVSRPTPMTVHWSSYAQSLTKKPVKGMLTGPVTILNWSFPRIDVSRETQSKQLALALRDEVLDLEKANIFAIQVDEPAIREGLPLRKADWEGYLRWAVDSFKLATSGVENTTQVHSHFCYSSFSDVWSAIEGLDCDVLSIEASKSDLTLLRVFKERNYTKWIGPGTWDIHSPRVPSAEEMQDKIKQFIDAGLKSDHVVINPDCGQKTRGWTETESQLANMVAAARWARKEYA